MPPTAERKRAGFVISDRLWVGMYGETFRAAGAGRRDLHALVVDARIGREPGVGAALLDDAVPALRPVHHRAIVGTVAAVRDAGELVVVTEAVPDSISLHDLLAGCRARSVKLTAEVAAAVGRAVIDAAATAHAAGVVHGAIHPRSVLIDADGNVRLADFAIGRATVTAVGRGASGELLKGLVGYVAPELGMPGPGGPGELPTPSSDVFALGALLYVMLSGELPPGTLHTSPAMERLVQRALDLELARRFISAIELQENFAEALEDDRWDAASTAELARFVARSRPSDSLDSATEHLLASLGASADPPTRSTLELDDLDDARSTGAMPGRDSGSLDSLINELEEDEPHTTVDGAEFVFGDLDRDPISEMLAIERARTGAPVVDEPEPPKKRGGERARRIGAAQSTAAEDAAAAAEASRARAAMRDAEHAIASLDETTEDLPPPRSAQLRADLAKAVPVPRPPSRTPVVDPFELDPMAAPSLKAPRRLSGLIWLVILAAAGAALVWVILDLRDKNRREEERRKREDEAAIKAKEQKEEELTAQLADPGAIRVTASPGPAAVWLLLGRTPFDSLGLPSGTLHELRVELDGYLPKDTIVSGKDWTGDGNTKIARVAVTLESGTLTEPAPPMPDTKPEVLGELQRGLKQGRGIIHVESTPAGAAVWLLVGNTASMKLEGVEAGRDYELRVLQKGYTPGYVRISAEEWRKGGDARLPLSAAPKHALLERHIDLVALPTPPGTKPPKNK